MASKAGITAEYARQIFDYNEKNGELIWRTRTPDMFVATEFRSAEWLCRKWNSTWAGKSAGGLRKGYLRLRLKGRKYTAARIIWLMIHGQWPKTQVDHRDGKRARNTLANLREATNAQNCQNRKKRSDNRSGYTGVHRDKSKWRAEICIKGKDIYLGSFESKDEAREVYLEAKAQYHSFQPKPRADA